MDVVRFALLGLGAGSVYALVALGLVLVYRGSGVLNFAQGAMGMIGAFTFYVWRDDGMPPVLSFVLSVALGVAIGVATHVVIMRPLRRAPAISRLIATLALLTVLMAIGLQLWGDTPRIVAHILPIGTVTVLPGVEIGQDRLWLFGVAVVLTAVLSYVYKHTRFGMATSAVAENRRVPAMLGISPDIVAAANWGLGAGLSVVAAILIVNVSGLNVTNLALLVVPGMAAALVGGFRSFWLTLAGGLMIGALESEIAFLQTKVSDPAALQGWGRSVPFVVIIIVLMVRGRALPLRSEAAERPPEVGTGKVRPQIALPLAAAGFAIVAFGLPANGVEAATTTATTAIVVLSLVVVTGYAGQLSLAQFALAGTGAWIATRLIVNYDISFELAGLIGILGTIPVGLLVGLPALRSRGVNLAVATLGLSLVVESLILNNPRRTGGITGTQIGSVRFFGIDFDTAAHPARYAALAYALFVVLAFGVANLRRGRAGRRLVAVRTNERAAASLGISVVGAKLYAFGLGAGIAAVGGVLIGFRRPSVVFYPTFSVFQSILVVLYAVIGGIGFVAGALIGAALAPGAMVPYLFGGLLDSAQAVQLTLGVLVFVVLLLAPNGIASLATKVRIWAQRGDALTEGGRPAITSKILKAQDVRVRFGVVDALSGVSIEVRPREVLGLIGPNGAGKSTLIDALTGFARPAAGSVLLDGDDVTSWSARRRAVAGVGRSFQSLELFDGMTVRENLRTAADKRDGLAYLTDLFHPGRAPLSPTASAVVREFGLEDDLDKRPEELSFGKRRLVALARAVAAEPSVLLLDEPAAGLGELETQELGRLIRRLADEWGMAVLLVEHDVSLVLGVCDRVAVLDFGHLIAEGDPTTIGRDRTVVQAYLGEEESTAVPRANVGTVDAEPLLAAHGLSAGYNDQPAVRDVELSVRRGEVLVVLGANGAGKTTTLLALAGELRPLSGEVLWQGHRIDAPLHRRAATGTALVPEERSAVRSLSVADNLRLGGVPVERAIALFPELEPLLGRSAGLISGGEQQMLTLARALGRDPQVVLADEVSLGLAPLVVDRLLTALREAADRGMAVVVVEQRARRALDIADNVVVLRRGRVELAGSAAELRGSFAQIERAYLTGVQE
ncbi:MAG TPA: ATP-binding cassette domain-containing protein [Acidimicrobiales bacterium]|nr:ATP-binding cassette domain-containing protein [Acidimicrobiales bacterium]